MMGNISAAVTLMFAGGCFMHLQFVDRVLHICIAHHAVDILSIFIALQFEDCVLHIISAL